MSDFPANRELVFDRVIDAPRAAVYRCWTEAELLKRWFAPAPWTVSSATIEPRPGGRNDVTMRSDEGQDMPAQGVFLDLVPNERLVFTDAFTGGFLPREGTPFMVVEVTLSDEGERTRYVARARHWTEEAAGQHEAMGFHTGWGICAGQLEALAQTL